MFLRMSDCGLVQGSSLSLILYLLLHILIAILCHLHLISRRYSGDRSIFAEEWVIFGAGWVTWR